jgi:N-acetylmuramoyl-L-alanine amidase
MFAAMSLAFLLTADSDVRAIESTLPGASSSAPAGGPVLGAATVVAPTVYQQGDPKLTYLGSWSNWSSPSVSGGSLCVTVAKGAAVVVTFTGTSFELLASTAPNFGKASVFVDGSSAGYVDLYSSGYLHKRSVFAVKGLADGNHTVTISCSGTKNSASSGCYINIDALKILGTLVQAPRPMRYQQDNAAFTYSGSWTDINDPSTAGGSLKRTDTPGSAVSVSFQGTYLAWTSKTCPWYGKAQLSLDGGDPFYVDLYSPNSIYQRKVYNTGLLTDGRHTLSIYMSGVKHSSSSGYSVSADCFDVLGDLSVAPEPPAMVTLYQQSDSRLTYLGWWSPETAAAASGGSLYNAGSRGAAVVISFKGTAVDLIGKKGPQYGKALVSVDGGPAEYVDLYASTAVHRQSVYKKEGLDDTQHTLMMEWAGVKNVASAGYLIGLDALCTTGTLQQAPKPSNFQQSDSHLGYAGRWLESVAVSASGGSFYYTNGSGAALTVRFDGSYLAWFAKKGPDYGKAVVRVDGGSAKEIDLYSSTPVYGQLVYSTRGLSPGAHTLTIESGQTKNAASTGYLVSVDALQVLGALCRLETSDLGPDRAPFALIGADKTRVTFTLGGAPLSVATAPTPEGDLRVDCTGSLPGCPALPLSVGSLELHSAVAARGPDPAALSLTLDMGRYRKFRVMSLAASEACGDRIVIDVYRRTDGPAGDGPPLVCLDPGHGGSDNHAIGVVTGSLEKNVNLAIAQSAAAYLRDAGLAVMLTRNSDTYLSPQGRCGLANAASASLFVSVHNNGFDDHTVGGTETFYMVKTAGYTTAATALAKAVQSRLVAALGFRDRGARTPYTGSLAVLNGTYMPAALAEIGFMSNPAEDAKVSSASGQLAAAKAVAEAIRLYLGWSTVVYKTVG